MNAKKDDEDSLYTKKCFRREVELLKELSHHSHIVSFEECVMQLGTPFLVMEKMSCTLLEVETLRLVVYTLSPRSLRDCLSLPTSAALYYPTLLHYCTCTTF